MGSHSRSNDEAAQSALGTHSRERALDSLATREFDLLVVGGGVTGVGTALDAALRGLDVALIEQADFGSGTSSKSSKLIHGGLRYLEQLDFALVREALRERGLLLRTLAPHLVTPVPFLLPLRHRVWERLYLGAGVALYDRLGGARSVPHSRHLSRRGVAALLPALKPATYVGGVQFWDAQTDDSRYVVTLTRTAALHGAAIASRVRANAFVIEDGRAVGVVAEDTETGRTLSIRARHVSTATGAWTGAIDSGGAAATPDLRPSKGVHLLLPRSAIDAESGLLARTETGLIFVIPWQGYWLIGDTDTEWIGDAGGASAEPADISMLLDRVNSQFSTAVTAEQILGVFAGIRPLVAADPSATTVTLSREHAITSPLPGVTAITGGKFTTYRLMAEHLVDAAAADLNVSVASTSARTPLVGAEGFAELWDRRSSLADSRVLSSEVVERLLRRYGALFSELFESIVSHPELGTVVPGTHDVLGAEIRYACTHEGALHLEDVLERRTHIAIQSRDRGLKASAHVAKIMSEALGWSDARTSAELASYAEVARAEHGDAGLLSPQHDPAPDGGTTREGERR